MDVVAMFKAIHTQEDKEAARQNGACGQEIAGYKAERIVNFIKNSVEETLTIWTSRMNTGADYGQIMVLNVS